MMKDAAGGSGAATLAMLAVLASACGAAPESSDPRSSPVSSPATAGEFSYQPFARALIEHVDAADRVDYAGLAADRGNLDAFVTAVGNLDPATYETWSSEERIAFWINAYNALTLVAIVDHYPIKASVFRSLIYPKNSIRQIPGVWDDLRFGVMGREVTLDQIEHEILRAEFDEPRIHMALVCAARSCPPLRWEPYTGDRLDLQLEDQTVRFLGKANNFSMEPEKSRVALSSIFDWFGDDFVSVYEPREGFDGYKPGQRAVLHFIALHLEGADKEFLEHGEYDIDYLDYDWSLNEAAPSPQSSQ